MHKLIYAISALAILGACSHQEPKKTVGKSFFEVIKRQHSEKRFPASSKSIPGVEEFIVALKENPSFINLPIGHELITHDIDPSDSYVVIDRTVFLKKAGHSYFSLQESQSTSNVKYNGGDFGYLELHEKGTIDDYIKVLSDAQTVESFKKISKTKFIVTFRLDSWICEEELDLTKYSEAQNSSCRDESGKIVSERRIASFKSVDVQDYVSSLKSVKLQVYPKALNCDWAVDDSEEENNCFISVIDEEKRDWSYILKK